MISTIYMGGTRIKRLNRRERRGSPRRMPKLMISKALPNSKNRGLMKMNKIICPREILTRQQHRPGSKKSKRDVN